MTLEVVQFDVTPGREADFLSDHLQARQLLAANPHCLGFSLKRCVERPGRFLFLVEWDSVEGHEVGFRSTAEFEAFKDWVRPHFERLEIDHYEPVVFTPPLENGEAARG